MSHFTIARLVSAGALVLALGSWPYGYYTLLRIGVCGVSAYGAYVALERQTPAWVWAFDGLAVLFNPLIPIHLDAKRGPSWTWPARESCWLPS